MAKLKWKWNGYVCVDDMSDVGGDSIESNKRIKISENEMKQWTLHILVSNEKSFHLDDHYLFNFS